jgi:uncharacterized protein
MEMRWVQIVFHLAVGAFLVFASAATAAGPSFDCTKVDTGSVEETICKDAGLSGLDRKMTEVFEAASKKAVNEHPPVLKAEQRGWIKGRNDCWKDADKRHCVEGSYDSRIAELQAKYRLVPGMGPVGAIKKAKPSSIILLT